MYARPIPEKVAPTYPKKPVIPHAPEIASFTVTLDACTPLIKFWGPSIKKPIKSKETPVKIILLGPE